MRRASSRGRGSLLCCLAIALLAAATAPDRVAAQESVAAGDQLFAVAEVKAAFLYHFGTFVQWPESALVSNVLTIAVLGDPAVTAELARLLPGRTIQGRPVRVRRLRTVDDLTNDELLYVGPRENDRLPEVLERVGQRPTLVVTDAPEGLAAGAMINFRLVDDRLRFEISSSRAESAGLRMSSRLLAAADHVETSSCETPCRRDLFRTLLRFRLAHAHGGGRALSGS